MQIEALARESERAGGAVIIQAVSKAPIQFPVVGAQFSLMPDCEEE